MATSNGLKIAVVGGGLAARRRGGTEHLHVAAGDLGEGVAGEGPRHRLAELALVALERVQ